MHNAGLNKEVATISLSDLKGKPVILDFWATWCSPCIHHLEKLEEWNGIYKDSIEILAVSLDDEKRLQRYVQTKQPEITVIADTGCAEIFSHKTIPHTVLIDAEGVVQGTLSGELVTEKMIKDLIHNRPLKIRKREEVKKRIEEYTIAEEDAPGYRYVLEAVNRGGARFNILEDESGVGYSLELNPNYALELRYEGQKCNKISRFIDFSIAPLW